MLVFWLSGVGSETFLLIVNGLEIRPTSCNGSNPVHDFGKYLPYQDHIKWWLDFGHINHISVGNFLCHSLGANNLQRPTLAEASQTSKYLTKSSFEVDSQASSPAVMGFGNGQHDLVGVKEAFAKFSLDGDAGSLQMDCFLKCFCWQPWLDKARFRTHHDSEL